MANARICKELYFETPDEVGILSKVTSAIADAGVNIQATCAFTHEEKGHFWMVTEDDVKAMDVLKTLGYEVEKYDVVLVDLEDKLGMCAQMTKKLADANINLDYIYGATGNTGNMSLMVFNSNDNSKALKVLSKTSS